MNILKRSRQKQDEMQTKRKAAVILINGQQSNNAEEVTK